MQLTFQYTVSKTFGAAGGNVFQQSPSVAIEISGAPKGSDGGPTVEQLAEAERTFRAWVSRQHPGEYLIKYETVPSDGSGGRFSEYRAYLPANGPQFAATGGAVANQGGADAAAVQPEALLDRAAAVEEHLMHLVPVIEVLDALRHQPQEQRHSIGGNNPPEPIDDVPPLDSAQLRMSIRAANVFRGELSVAAPRNDVFQLCLDILERTAAQIASLGRWIAAKGNIFVDAFLKGAGEAAGKTLMTAAIVGGMIAAATSALGTFVSEATEFLRQLH